MADLLGSHTSAKNREPKEVILSNYKIPIKALILNHEKFDKENYRKLYYRDDPPADRTGSEEDVKKLEDTHEFDKENHRTLFYPDDPPADRTGSGEDVKMLKDTLEYLGANEIEIAHNLKLTEIEAKMESYAEAVGFDPADLGCLMIVVLTHGMSGGVLLAQDKMYNHCQIWDPIVNSTKLKGIPKIFVFLACRSSPNSTLEIRIDTTDELDDEPSEDKGNVPQRSSPRVPYTSKYLPNADDVIVCYSTVENKVSKRSDLGTWYIGLLCKHLREWNQRGLLDILTKVNEELINNHGTPAVEIPVGQDVSNTSHTGEPQTKQTQETSAVEIPVGQYVSNTSHTGEPQTKQTQETDKKLLSSQTATYSSYLKQDIKFNDNATEAFTSKENKRSSSVEGPSGSGNKSPNLETDGAGVIQQVDTLTKYCNANTYQGRFYIFHDINHLNEALELKAVAELLKLNPIIKQENSKTSCFEYLAKESKLTDFKDHDILFVAYLGHFDEPQHFTEEIFKFERSFKSRVCPSLAGKPKVFIFLDVHEIESRREENDGERQNQYATDSSDFLLIRSSGKVYKTILFEQLGLAIGKDLLGILTECTRLYKEQSEHEPKMKPHFESTLTRAIYLATKTQREKKQSFPMFGVKDESSHHIERTTEHKELLTNLLERSKEPRPLLDVVIHGNQGVGKTQFIYHLMNSKEVQSKFTNRLVFDASNEATFQESLTEMNESNHGLKISDCSLIGVCTYIDKKCAGKTLIIFDNYNPDTFELELHAKLGDNLYYVAVTRQDSESIQARHKIEITEFTAEQSMKLFKTLLNCEQQTRDLVKIFGNNPLVISLVCDYVSEKTFEDNKFDITSKLITPFSKGNSNYKITVDYFETFYKKNKDDYNLDAVLGKYFVFQELNDKEDGDDSDDILDD